MKNETTPGIYFLNEGSTNFPPPSKLSDPELGAIGGSLNEKAVMSAYRKGYFPWFYDKGLWYWFHPDPRMVLFPEELIVSKSMRPYINGNRFRFKMDSDFDAVIKSCRMVRRWNGETNSWINDEIIECYSQLFRSGIAHCAEAWAEGKLVGGLYGLRIGDIFFGESMFSTESNASKFAFIKFVRHLQKSGVRLIDCQQQTHHMATLGARAISRKKFVGYLERLIPENGNIW